MIETELCAYGIEACRAAARAGLTRVELCASPYEGGTTPSAAAIRLARRIGGVRLSVMIRPRGGDFLYTDEEFAQMLDDVRFARAEGADCVVAGLLTADGRIDEARTATLVAEAGGMEVTFHRAFDMVRDQREALEALLTQKLLYNQALIDSVDISSADIQTRVEEQLQNMIEEEGSIPKLEAKHHMPIFNLREILRQRYEEQAYASSMQAEVVNKVTIIPGEVERYYKQIDKDSLPLIADQFVYAQITRFPKSMTEAKQRTRERLLDLRERVITGQAKFENLARMYSQDPGTAMRGGEMEPTPLASLDQAFADALAELKPGQISEVVETQFGFHIIQYLEKRGNLYRFRHILLRPVYTTEELSSELNFLDSLVTEIRRDSITFEQAALRYSDDASSKMNGGIVSNHDVLERFNAFDAKLTVTKFLKEDFGRYKSLDDYNALIRLHVGEISGAYLTEDMLGNQMAKVVKLVQIIPTHVASLNEDYLRLEEMALAAKQEKAFREWLTKKIDGMYVYIDPEFRDGAFENKHWVK